MGNPRDLEDDPEENKPADNAAGLVASPPPKEGSNRSDFLDLRSAPSRALRKCPTVRIDRENRGDPYLGPDDC